MTSIKKSKSQSPKQHAIPKGLGDKIITYLVLIITGYVLNASIYDNIFYLQTQ